MFKKKNVEERSDVIGLIRKTKMVHFQSDSSCIIYIFLIIFHPSVGVPRALDNLNNFSIKEQSLTVIQQHQNVKERPATYTPKEIETEFGSNLNDSFEKGFNEIEDTDKESFSSSFPHSSKFDNLATDLGPKSSSLIENENDYNRSIQDDQSNIMPFLNAFSSSKFENHQPESYYNHLYELAMNINHVQKHPNEELECDMIAFGSFQAKYNLSHDAHQPSKSKL